VAPKLYFVLHYDMWHLVKQECVKDIRTGSGVWYVELLLHVYAKLWL